MTRTTRSQDSGKWYSLTLNQYGEAVDCTCPDRKYRGRDCKHMNSYNVELGRATTFVALMARFDVRNQASREQAEMLARVQAAQLACYTEAEIRAAQQVYQSRAFSLMR